MMRCKATGLAGPVIGRSVGRQACSQPPPTNALTRPLEPAPEDTVRVGRRDVQP